MMSQREKDNKRITLLLLISIVWKPYAPCSVVIAWAKFAKAESPTNILNFLDRVYPDANTCSDYVCIDKACLVL
jgi:hypothetical protein